MVPIALMVGELSAILTVDNSQYKRGLREAKGDMDGLARDVKASGDSVGSSTQRMVASVGDGVTRLTRDAQGKLRNSRGQFATDAEKIAAGIAVEFGKGGEKSGGVLAKGIQSGLIRNSPLIVAAAAGALAAGAPAMLAGATGLFAGIGIVAAAQSVRVQAAWKDTWSAIRDGAVADSAPIQSVLVRLADTVGSSFERMRPALRGIFADVAPQIEVFTGGLMGMVNNALPGFQRAIERSMPVMQGFASFLESLGTGMTRFLDNMSTHAPAAGAAFAAIGRILEELLPTLGTLLGTGAELAAVVLPPLASVLGVVASALESVDGILPAVAAGFIALKVAQTAIGWVGGLGDALGKAKDALTGINPATVALTGIIGGFIAVQQQASATGQRWADALLQGGRAADTARTQMSSFATANAEASQGLGGFVAGLVGVTGQAYLTGKAVEEGSNAYRDMLAAMDPVSRAAALLTQAENDLAFALEEHGAGSREAEAAQRAYESALAESESANSSLETAIHGVTSAMIAQANQALAASDSEYAYRGALESVDDQVRAVAESQRDHGAASEEASDALFALEGTLRTAAQAAGQLASDALPASASELQRNQASASGYLDELLRLRDQMGSAFPAALNTTIANLQRTGVQLDTVGGKASGATGLMQTLGAQRPSPIAFLNDGPFSNVASWILGRVGTIGGQRPTPVATLIAQTGSAEWALNQAARNRTSIVTQVVNYKYGTGTMAQGGRVGDTPMRPARGFAIGGKLSGPGTSLSDSIGPFRVPGGDVFLSNDEWIVPARVGDRQGNAKMAALVSGMADIVMRSDRSVRGLAAGGRVSTMNPVTGTGHGNGRDVMVNVNVRGVDFSKREDRRRLVMEIRQGLIEVERADA